MAGPAPASLLAAILLVRKPPLSPRDSGGITMDKALVSYGLITHRHGGVALVVRRNGQPRFDSPVVADRTRQESVEAATQTKGVGEQ